MEAKRDPVTFMGQHLVALTCDYETIHADGTVCGAGVSVYSGFVLELHGVLFWVTAGHCLKDELDANIESGKLRITGGAFMDCFGYQAKHLEAVPFTYEVGCSYYVEQRGDALDFALIMLNSLQVKAFIANNVKAISRSNWVHQPRLSFDFYRMMGIPKHGIVRAADDNGEMHTQVRPLLIAINKIGIDEIGEVPPDVEVPSEEWFIGRIDPECETTDLAGMSGGPIYGFRKNDEGQLTYHVVALQSRWWPKSRTIFGCSMTLFAEEVYQQLGSFIERFDSKEETDSAESAE
jgi:hypothetical protein